ncbi:MAG: hypothetical protein RLZZ524_3005 [Pseudomonadota bacterium]|jgi:hypothetical protein
MAFNLASLQKNAAKPPRIIIHGDPGVGKTTFAACAPSPVILQTEDGLGNLDVTAFPLAKKFEDVLDAIGSLYTEPHEFGTLVVDSLDWLEPLVWDKVCRESKVDSIEKLGYGKGYVEALTYWRQFYDGITALRDSRGMVVIMTAHSQIIHVEDPSLPAYDSHDLKLHKRAAALAEEFADVILYAAVQTNTVTEDAGFNSKRVRATTTGARVMHTVGQPAFLAKNRYSLPSPLPLAWEAFAGAMWPAATPEPVELKAA